jgi:hypothetical protein
VNTELEQLLGELPMRLTSAVVGLVLAGLAIAWVGYAPTALVAESSCTAPDEWFVDNKTPQVAEDFKVPTDDECNFYKWAWQSFLWLTQSDKGVSPNPRFMSFKTSNELFQHPNGERVQLIVSPTETADKKKLMSLTVRTSPSSAGGNVSAVAIEQAGSQGVLVDQNHRCLYYGIHVNDRFVRFINDELKLTDPEKIKDVDPKKQFPPGCLELKSSWRALADEERKPENRKNLEERFFITEAVVPTLFTDSDGRIKADPKRPRQETVALVGLHVVGTIVDHPEFIWASFEHVDNSPVLKDQHLPQNQAVDNTRGYTFYAMGTTRLHCNKNPVNTSVDPLKLADEDKQTLNPIVNVFRQFNSGENGVDEDEDVRKLNESVHGKLKANLDVWKNYALSGAVWLKNPAASFAENKQFADDVLAGEAKLSNSTMETFTQIGKANCFSCHQTASEIVGGKTLPGMRIKVSHVIRNAYLPIP